MIQSDSFRRDSFRRAPEGEYEEVAHAIHEADELDEPPPPPPPRRTSGETSGEPFSDEDTGPDSPRPPPPPRRSSHGSAPSSAPNSPAKLSEKLSEGGRARDDARRPGAAGARLAAADAIAARRSSRCSH